jgi:nitrate reductase assembly molybdenum cofactor insertion protein NarJ
MSIQELTSRKGKLLGALARLLDYPSENYLDSFDSVTDQCVQLCPDAKQLLVEFSKFVSETPRPKLEETYTRNFDLAPLCSPYVSGYIYGDENFDRGSLLSRLNDRFEEIGFDRKGELCDHLGVLLSFSERLSIEEIDDLCELVLVAPLKEMVSRLADCQSPYHPLMKAIEIAVKTHH